MAENKETLLMNINEACALLHLGKNTIYRLVRENKLPTVKWSQKILIPRAALEKMLAQIETGTERS